MLCHVRGGPWHTFPLGKVALPSSSAKGVLLNTIFLSQPNARLRLCLRMRMGHKMWVAGAASGQHPGHSWGLPLQAPWAGDRPSICLSMPVHPPACLSPCLG